MGVYFFFKNRYPECDYRLDLRICDLEEGIVLAVAFIPVGECDQDTINRFLNLMADSVDIALDCGANMLIFREEDNFNQYSNPFEYEELHFMYFLLFPDDAKLESYLKRMIEEDIFTGE